MPWRRQPALLTVFGQDLRVNLVHPHVVTTRTLVKMVLHHSCKKLVQMMEVDRTHSVFTFVYSPAKCLQDVDQFLLVPDVFRLPFLQWPLHQGTEDSAKPMNTGLLQVSPPFPSPTESKQDPRGLRLAPALAQVARIAKRRRFTSRGV